MTARRSRRRAPLEPAFQLGQLLDWRDGSHWSDRELPCRYCGFLTHLRDSRMKPAHKVCAEDALTTQARDAQAAYHQNGQTR